MDPVQLKQVVITTLTRRGKGKDGDPIRIITEVWDAETGDKIAEDDPFMIEKLGKKNLNLKDSGIFQLNK